MNVKIFYVQFQDLLHQCHTIFFDIKFDEELMLDKILIFTNIYPGKYFSNSQIKSTAKIKFCTTGKLKWQVLKMILDKRGLNFLKEIFLQHIYIRQVIFTKYK